MIYVYRIKNNLTGTYFPGYEFDKDEPESYFRRNQEGILMHPENYLKADLHLCKIEYIGILDQQTGFIKPADEILEFDLQTAYQQRMAIEEGVKNGKAAQGN